MINKIDEKYRNVLLKYVSPVGEKPVFGDNINGIFSIDTKEAITASIEGLLNDANVLKIYSNTERLEIFRNIIEASYDMGNDITDIIKEVSKGGFTVKVYTEEEMQAKAKELADSMFEEKLKSTAKEDTESLFTQKLDEVKAQVTALEKKNSDLEQKVADAEKEKQDILAEQKKQETIAKRTLELKALGFDFEANKEMVATYLTSNDGDYENFKKIIAKIAADTANDIKAKAEAEKAKLGSDGDLAAASTIVPNNVSDAGEGVFDKIMKEKLKIK